MRRRLTFIAIMTCIVMPLSVSAEMRELSAVELRQQTKQGKAIGFRRAIKSVAKAIRGAPVDARAFQDESTFYRILVKKDDGRVVSVILDAETGHQVSAKSKEGRDVNTAAKKNDADEVDVTTTAAQRPKQSNFSEESSGGGLDEHGNQTSN